MKIVSMLSSFFIGVYLTGALFVFISCAGDLDGRFRYRYLFLWPLYIKRLFLGELP